MEEVFNEENGMIVGVYGWKMFKFTDKDWLYDTETKLGCVGHFKKDTNGGVYPFIYHWAIETREEGPGGELQYAKSMNPKVSASFPIIPPISEENTEDTTLQDLDPLESRRRDQYSGPFTGGDKEEFKEELDQAMKEIESECNSYLDKGMKRYSPQLTKEVKQQLEIQKCIPETIIVKEGVELSRCPSFMVTPENEHLYPNLDYFMDLVHSGDGIWSYFIGNEEGKEPAPSTWGTDMEDTYDKYHPSNPLGLQPTFHEIDVMVNVFGSKPFGEIEFLDTRKCEENPPLRKMKFIWKNEILQKKTKLPPGWHRNLNKEKGKYYYWNEKHRVSQWNHPWPTLIGDIQKKIHLFNEISENFSRPIHGNMGFKDMEYYEILDKK